MLYDPDEMEENGPAEPGDYFFKINQCDPHTSEKGNEGMKLELTVRVGKERNMKIFDYLMFTKNALWKMRDFCNAIGVDFYKDNDMKPRDYLGYVGKASFELREPNQKGRRYLGIGSYLPLEGDPKKVEVKEEKEEAKEKAPAAETSADDEVPF